MKRLKAAFGTLLSLAAVVAFLVVFSVLVRLGDRAMGAPATLPAVTAVFLGAAAAAIGIFWVTWAYGYLIFVGRGSPAELFGVALLPTRQLVTCGPFAYTRNPMVFGVLWMALGVAFYRRSLTGLVLVPILGVLSIAYIKLFEEPGLERRFGAPYHRYREQVPALFPRFRAIVTGEPEEACQTAPGVES